MQNITDPAVQATLVSIAVASFPSVETLEVQNSDGLDFHDVSVWSIKQALEMAFLAGQRSASQPLTQKSAR